MFIDTFRSNKAVRVFEQATLTFLSLAFYMGLLVCSYEVLEICVCNDPETHTHTYKNLKHYISI